MNAGTGRSLKDKRVTVVGLGRFGGGIGVTRWLCGQGAKVTVTDKASAESLAESLRAIADCPVTLRLGSHESDDFDRADLLVVSPAVPKDVPQLRAALDAGVPMTTEINLFLERCRAPIVGITGTVGKSTTTAMVGAILARRFTTHVGGNIGKSLLDTLEDIRSDHVVVLELSSFQLEDVAGLRMSPHVAVVTNLLPNHLDRHGTMEAYGQAKMNLFAFQKPDDVLVLNRDCPITSRWASLAKGRVEFFGEGGEPFDLAVPGPHNQVNAQAAWTACRAMGVSRAEAADALRTFAGLPHRLKFVAEKRGVRYFNDSKCTTPEGAIVAINAFAPRSAVIIMGGYDKHVEFDEMGKALAQRAKAVIGLGATKDKILACVEAARTDALPAVERASDLADAVERARAHAAPGGAVLLSPACASYDMFVNYEQRGDLFAQLVEAMDAGN